MIRPYFLYTYTVFILSEAELACKSEADGHTYYVMSMR